LEKKEDSLPKTIHAAPYAGGNPEYAEVVKQRPRLELQIESLRLAIPDVANQANREATAYYLIGSLILTWPWSTEHIDEVGRLIENADLPEWVILIARQVIQDIKSGELVNSRVNTFDLAELPLA
jgi:hypothetical protein